MAASEITAGEHCVLNCIESAGVRTPLNKVTVKMLVRVLRLLAKPAGLELRQRQNVPLAFNNAFPCGAHHCSSSTERIRDTPESSSATATSPAPVADEAAAPGPIV